MNRSKKILSVFEEAGEKYTVEAGRSILMDGKPFIVIQRTGNIDPVEADNITHVIADLLNKYERV